MLNIKKTCAVALLVGGLLATTAFAEGVPMTEADFIATHVGKCVVYTGGSDGRQCYSADGTTNYEDVSYGSDTGNWSFVDGNYCVSYVQSPAWSCSDWVITGDNAYAYADGSYTWYVE